MKILSIIVLESILKGRGIRCEQKGYQCELFSLESIPSAAAAARTLRARGIRGLIIAPVIDPVGKMIFDLDWEKFTSVACGRGKVELPCHIVAHSAMQKISLAIEQLRLRGYIRIGFSVLVHEPYVKDDLDRCSAIKFYQSLIPKNQRVETYLYKNYDRAGFLNWLQRTQPEAILFFNNEAVDKLGYPSRELPESLGVAVLHLNEHSPLAGIPQDHRVLGIEAVDLVSSEIYNNKWGSLICVRLSMSLERGERVIVSGRLLRMGFRR